MIAREAPGLQPGLLLISLANLREPDARTGHTTSRFKVTSGPRTGFFHIPAVNQRMRLREHPRDFYGLR
jgi:hypothetical protein